MDRSAKDILIRNLPYLMHQTTLISQSQEKQTILESAENEVEWIKPDKSLVEAIERFRKGDLNRIIEDGEKGRLPKAAIYSKLLMENIKKWELIVEQTRANPIAYQQALWTHIYSQLTFDH